LPLGASGIIGKTAPYPLKIMTTTIKAADLTESIVAALQYIS
jgi:hypothetical protein